jgi:hypothetical protein
VVTGEERDEEKLELSGIFQGKKKIWRSLLNTFGGRDVTRNGRSNAV